MEASRTPASGDVIYRNAKTGVLYRRVGESVIVGGIRRRNLRHYDPAEGRVRESFLSNLVQEYMIAGTEVATVGADLAEALLMGL